MASREQMLALYREREERFPSGDFKPSIRWWEEVSAHMRASAAATLTVKRAPNHELTDGVPITSDMLDWLLSNIGPEGMKNYNEKRSPFMWQVGAWDWLWRMDTMQDEVDIFFVDLADATAFKIRWL